MATHENAHEAVHALDEALHSTGACSDYLGWRCAMTFQKVGRSLTSIMGLPSWFPHLTHCVTV